MHIEVDTHTHTILSGHAYSTLLENITQAAKVGLKLLVNTEHGPSMANCPPEYLFGGNKLMPENEQGVRVLLGIEANILAGSGEIDLTVDRLLQVPFVNASLHLECFAPGTREKNTRASINALRNPFVDVLGHPDMPDYDTDLEAIVLEAKANGKMLELNNHSFKARPLGYEKQVQMLELCKQHSVRITMSSDSHIYHTIGNFDDIIRLIELTDFPEELIVNRTLERFEAYLEERAARIEAFKASSNILF